MVLYDQALAKSLETGDSRDLCHVGIYGDLEKAHVKAHFRLNAKTGRREFIKDYDDARDKDQVHVAFHRGHKVKVNNPKSKHHGKTMEVSGYSDKYDVVRGKIDGEKHAVDFHADHLEHYDSKGSAKPSTPPAEIPKTDFTKMSDDQLYKYNNTLLKLARDIHQHGTDDMKRNVMDIIADLAAEVKSRKVKQDVAKGPSFKPGDTVAINHPGVGWSDDAKPGMDKITYKIKKVNDINVVLEDGTVVKKDQIRPVKAKGSNVVAEMKKKANASKNKRVHQQKLAKIEAKAKASKRPQPIKSFNAAVPIIQKVMREMGIGLTESYMKRAHAYAKGVPADEYTSKLKMFFGGEKTPDTLKVEPAQKEHSPTKKEWGSEKEVKGVTQDFTPSGFEKRFPHIKEFFDQAENTAELGNLKRQAGKFAEKNNDGWKWGPIDHFHQEKADELRRKGASGHKQTTAEDARMDRLLRTRDSSGKATPRKWR